MLSFNHIVSVISTEASTYTTGSFLSTLLLVWFAYFITGSLKRIGFKIFWFIYSIIQLYFVMSSNVILHNPMFYFGATVFLLQLNFHKLLKKILLMLKEKTQRKYDQCVSRNMYYDSVQEKVRREEESAKQAAIKNADQKIFLDKLDKKLDGNFIL